MAFAMKSAARPDPWITTTGVPCMIADMAVCRVFSPPSNTSSTRGMFTATDT